MKPKFILLSLSMLSMSFTKAQNELNLSGPWQVSIDSMESFRPITLPNTLDLAGIGTPNTLRPALTKPQLLHLTRKHRFVGAAFYRRTVEIPKAMENKPLTLTLERIIWQSQVWIDGKKVTGERESLTTPHVYTIADGLKAGRHELLVRIDNRKRYDISAGEMAHAYTDETQVKWNGILGRMTLKAENPVKVLSVMTFPDVKNRSVRVLATLVRTLPKKKSYKGRLAISVTENNAEKSSVSFPVVINQDTMVVEKTLPMGDDVKLWNEFSPQLYGLRVGFMKGKSMMDSESTTFGMREINVRDGHLAINGHRIFLRGTLECCIFPLTGCPPTDDAGWEKVFKAAKAWGLNHFRFHSYCPPEAAFRVADRVGFYLQVELPVWSMTIGKDPAMNRFLYNEYDNIVSQYGNHPSFCLLSVGNELQPDFSFLNQFVNYMKRHDNRHLYTTSSFTFEGGHGSKPEPEDQYFVTQWTDKGWVRGQGVFEAKQPDFDQDYRAATADINVPLVSHEIGQYGVYPNMQEISKYTGCLDPLNFKAIRNDLEQKGLLHKAADYLKASGQLAVQLYKEEIERAMKTPKFDGFQLLGLQDFSGQGTALVGLVDAFWDSKGLVPESYFRQFNAPVVPLARFKKAIYTNGETFRADIEVANYSGQDIKGKPIQWLLTDEEGKTVGKGSLPAQDIPSGGVTPIRRIEIPLSTVESARRLILQAGIKGTEWKNSWNVWVYPENLKMAKTNVVMTQDIAAAKKALQQGKSVLFSPKKENVKGLEGKFLPVFWSPVHFPHQAGTMGLLVNKDHPALAHFPTEMHSNWQWWNLVKRSRVMVIDSIKGASPIVEDVDNFTNNRRLASIFEAQCGKGKLIVCTMDVLSECEGMPEVKQMLYSLLSYMNSKKFNPSGTITEEELTSLWDSKKTDKTTTARSVYQ